MTQISADSGQADASQANYDGGQPDAETPIGAAA
jgi:hypothetical protein